MKKLLGMLLIFFAIPAVQAQTTKKEMIKKMLIKARNISFYAIETVIPAYVIASGEGNEKNSLKHAYQEYKEHKNKGEMTAWVILRGGLSLIVAHGVNGLYIEILQPLVKKIEKARENKEKELWEKISS